MRLINILLLFALGLTFTSYTVAQDAPIRFSNSNETLNIGDEIYILEDKEGTMKVQEVMGSKDFKKSDQQVPNLNVSNTTFWVKFTVKNVTGNPNLLVDLSQPTIDEVTFYSINPGGGYTMSAVGEHFRFSQRNYNYQDYIFELNIPKDSSRVFLFKVKSGEQIQLPITIGTSQTIIKTTLTKDLIFGIYCGIIIVMLLYNLFIYLSTRDKAYLYYVVYILIVGLTQANFQGYAFRFIWPESFWLAKHAVYLLSCFVGIASVAFMRVFIHIKDYSTKLDKLFLPFIVTYIICIGLALTGYYNASYQLIQLNAMLLALYMVFVAYRIMKQGSRPAMFYLVAWSMFLAGVVLFVMKDYGILPYNNFTYYTMPLGSALEVILLSFGLADRINILKKEKEESQARTLEALRENERIVREQNTVLEAKVKERTAELEKSNYELNIAIKNLKEAQSQLVEAEKMASLGQLTAGIAHEINNPINFVTSNIRPLSRDVEDILTILEKYEEINIDERDTLEQKLAEIKQLKEELDSEYLIEEINSLLKGIGDGASRTAEIVKGLRNFSRVDEDVIKKADLNEGIDSTLTLLRNSMQNKVQVVKNFGDIPQIDCYAGKLNQVFMNIINNAAQAIMSNEEKGGNGLITITTSQTEKDVVVSIADDGTGMPDDVKNRIFEPFFTTKAVGDGTGLGLSIVYSIIENHHGDIKVNSKLGEGTEFIITLPKSHV